MLSELANGPALIDHKQYNLFSLYTVSQKSSTLHLAP